MSSKSSSVRAKPSRSPAEPEGDKSARILDAAQALFMRYGVKRTAMDDVAREAGIAKGTLYLYYDSKDALFAGIARRMCDEVLGKAREAAASRSALPDRLVGVLDAKIGAIHRLLASSPHSAELIESKEVLATSTFADLDREFRAILRDILSDAEIAGEGVVELFLAAAFGAIKTGDLAEKPYRARLKALVETLLAGLKRQHKA
jgi:AcrR family transcriptional regulator